MKLTNKGLSLIEVMVVVGLLSLISVGMIEFISGAFKQQRGVQAKDHQRELTAQIEDLLTNEQACIQSFAGLTIPASTASQLKDALGNVKYTINTDDENKFLHYEKFNLDNFVADSSSPSLGRTDFKVFMSKVGDTGTAKNIRPDVITLKVELDAAGRILRCFAIGSGSEGLWKRSPLDLNKIYYSGGEVGIGTQSPEGSLHLSSLSNQGVSMVIQAAETGGAKHKIAITGSASVNGPRKFMIRDETSASSVIDSNFTIWGNRVGVMTAQPSATLDVRGTIRVGFAGIGCDPTIEGSQRYNASIKNMEFCNGTSWQAFGVTKSITVYSPQVNGTTSVTCPAAHILSSCFMQIDSDDNESHHFKNNIGFLLDAQGQVNGCNGISFDSHDRYRLVALCIK